jgi:CubicO group peptidase (beta-lactamase class C family)
MIERQPEATGWLETLAKQLKEEFHLPAVWLAINHEDRLETAVLGVHKYGESAPASLEDKLTIASISKPMAGFWIASLVDRGMLTYETRVLEILPELSAICLPEHREITLAQLLTHTAGVIRDVKQLPSNLRLDQYPQERLNQAREVLSSPAPENSKGKSVYSNNGMTLAATMAERVVREPYETAGGRFYRERLGLRSWGVWPMSLPEDISVPWPHELNNNVPVPRSPRSVAFQFVRPSGSVHCTISDLVRFGLIATNATDASRSLLKPETWARLTEPSLGSSTTLCSFSMGPKTVYGHGGSLGTTRSTLSLIADWRVAFAVHTNANSEKFTEVALRRMQDAFRQRRAKRAPVASCAIYLTEVTTVDETWKISVEPKRTDEKIRIRVRFHIDARRQTGDLQTIVKLGDVERVDNRFTGLVPGDHVLHFEFDTPKTTQTPVFIQLDALETANNRTTRPKIFKSVLSLP